ncbi:DUF4244 domain-containing protein [Streptomyces sp. NPDC054863]
MKVRGSGWDLGLGQGWDRVRARVQVAGDSGMTTSEYAVGTIAACAFAAVLYKVVSSDAVSTALQAAVERALDVQF